MQASEQQVVDDVYRRYNSRADSLYEFVVHYHDMMTSVRDYGTKHRTTMVEMHTLTAIEENPGTTITELSKMWNRTKGSVSQTVSRLEAKGLVYRKRDDKNRKTVCLYPTDEGKKLCRAHKIYDIADIKDTMNELLKHCTVEEIDSFYKVIDHFNAILGE